MLNTSSVSLSLTVCAHTFFFQIALTQKFKDAFSGAAVNVTALYVGTRYSVLHCERVETKYGMSVRVTLHEEADDNVMVFLPRHYDTKITDEFTAAIYSLTNQCYLTYKGKSATSNCPMLQKDV